MTTTTTRDLAQRLARKVFETRGNNAEAHITESELTALFEVVSDLTLKVRPTPMAVAALTKEPS